MSACTAAILAAMVTLVPPAKAERDRYRLIADTISITVEEDVEAKRTAWTAPELAAMLVATAYHESRFARAIHSGAEKGDRRRGVSTCLMQINRRSYRPVRGYDWDALAGVAPEPTRACIETGAGYIEHAAERCGRSFGCVMAVYQGHKSRRNDETRKRVSTFWRVYGMLRDQQSRRHHETPEIIDEKRGRTLDLGHSAATRSAGVESSQVSFQCRQFLGVVFNFPHLGQLLGGHVEGRSRSGAECAHRGKERGEVVGAERADVAVVGLHRHQAVATVVDKVDALPTHGNRLMPARDSEVPRTAIAMQFRYPADPLEGGYQMRFGHPSP